MFSLTGYFNRQSTFRGEVTDFDYDGDNRTIPTTQLYLQSNKGHSSDVGIHANFHFLETNDFSLSSSAGFGFNRELFYITDDNDPALNTTYQADWTGPNLSLDGQWQAQKFSFGIGVTGRALSYKAKANWNLIENFQHPVSFTHKATGFGIDNRLSFAFRASHILNIGLDLLNSNWQTQTGLDKLYQSDGQIIRAQMNGAIKHTVGARLSTTFLF